MVPAQIVRRARARGGRGGGGGMASGSRTLRVGIAGCGRAARVHLGRLLARDEVHIVGVADTDRAAAEALAARVPERLGEPPVVACSDHRELLRKLAPDALAIFT